MNQAATYDRTIRLAVMFILVVAAMLRLRGIGFGLPALHDPDEPLFMLMGFHLLTEGTLNPGWFGHPGSTTIYMIALVEIGTYFIGHLLGIFADQKSFADAIYADPGIVFLPMRVVIAAFGVACVFLTWKIGERLGGSKVGLVAAAFLAFNPLHIQYSQIIRTDVQATVFMLLCVWFSLEYLDSGRRRHLLVSAIWCGVAIATKWPAATVFICPLLAAGLVARRESGADVWRHWILSAILAGTVAIAAMIIVSPYLVLDFETVLRNLTGEARPTHLSVTGHGFLGNLGWYLSGPIASSIGIAGALVALAGTVSLVRNRKAAAIVGAVPLVFITAISAQSLIWARWVLPILPFLSLFMAFGLMALLDKATELGGFKHSALLMAVAMLFVVVPMGWTAHLDARERMNDTRSQATNWAVANIPAGRRIAIEYLGVDMLRRGWTILFPAGDAGCIDAEAALSGKVQFGKTEKMRGGTMVVNLGTIPPEQRDTCRADYALMIYRDRYLSERANFPREAAAYDALMTSGKLVATFKPQRGLAGGPTVYIVQFGTEN